MSRRVSLPGADELFRSTRGGPDGDERVDAKPSQEPTARESPAEQPAAEKVVGSSTERGADNAVGTVHSSRTAEGVPDEKGGPSGRVRHDEKITVYVTADELLDLERTRLVLRGEHRLAVDRGRIVREAIHLALKGVETDGEASALVQRLRER